MAIHRLHRPHRFTTAQGAQHCRRLSRLFVVAVAVAVVGACATPAVADQPVSAPAESEIGSAPTVTAADEHGVVPSAAFGELLEMHAKVLDGAFPGDEYWPLVHGSAPEDVVPTTITTEQPGDDLTLWGSRWMFADASAVIVSYEVVRDGEFLRGSNGIRIRIAAPAAG